METVPVSPRQKAALEAPARHQGKSLAAVADEAFSAYLDYQGWAEDARRKIEEAWQQSERGETVEGEASRRRLDARHAALLKAQRPG